MKSLIRFIVLLFLSLFGKGISSSPLTNTRNGNVGVIFTFDNILYLSLSLLSFLKVISFLPLLVMINFLIYI